MILSISNAVITSVPDTSQNILELLGCWEEPNGNYGSQAQNGTPTCDNNTAGRRVKEAIRLNNPMLLCIVHRSPHNDCTPGAQTSMHCGCTN